MPLAEFVRYFHFCLIPFSKKSFELLVDSYITRRDEHAYIDQPLGELEIS